MSVDQLRKIVHIQSAKSLDYSDLKWLLSIKSDIDKIIRSNIEFQKMKIAQLEMVEELTRKIKIHARKSNFER